MKIINIILFCLFLELVSFAQGSLETTIKVVNVNGSAAKGLYVVLRETSTNKKITYRTDSYGKVVINLDEGRFWWLSIGKLRNMRQLEVPENGRASGSQYITYDVAKWEREHRRMPDRSKINFTVEKQKIKANHKATKTHSVVELKIKKLDKTPLLNFPVRFTCLATKIQYEGKTDYKGVARFFIPINNDYEIDIDGIDSYKFMDFGKYSGYESFKFTYEPTNIKEKIVGDTIYQDLPESTKPSSSRFLQKINVKDTDGNMLADETVYLNHLRSSKVYLAKTNQAGVAVFMLPIKRKYMIHFEYRKDIDVINLMYIKGIGNGKMTLTYRPNPKLSTPEQFIPTTEELIITDFNKFLEKQFPEPEKEKAIRIILEWGNNIINGASKEAILNVGFSVTDDSSNKYGSPLNLAFVMDKSGSMEGYDRIDQLKTSLVTFVSSLRSKDIVSLIIFESEPELLVSAGKIASRKRSMIENIEMIEAGGGTNIHKGMILGYKEVEKNMITGGTNRVILLTDGYGITPVDTITAKSKEYNKKGIQLSAIGVGLSYNQALLRLLATDGSGTFQQVSETYSMENSFKKELSSILYPVAKDVNIEIEYNDMIIFKNLYGFEFKKKATNKVSLSLDNIYSGLNKLAIVKFNLNNANKKIEKKPVIIRMTYFNYRTNKQETIIEKAYLKWSKEVGKYELIYEAEYKRLYAIAIMNQALKVMADAFQKNKFIEAQKSIDVAILQIEKLYPNAKQSDIETLYKQLKEYTQILTQYKKNKFKRKAKP